MSSVPNKQWDNNLSQNASLRVGNQNGTFGRTAPLLPPRPDGLYRPSLSYSSPYSSYNGGGYGGFGGYAGMSSYGSYGMPYNSYGMYNGHFGGYSSLNTDAERRFIQYAEENSRNTFANVENIVRAFGSIAMMLDSTFFAMTSSFRAVLSVAENFGRLRSTFGQIWYSVSLFRFLSWVYRKIMEMLGFKMRSSSSIAWQAAGGSDAFTGNSVAPPSSSNWPTLAFLGALISAPYIINKFLPKYEDKSDMASWKSPGVPAKAAFDFMASNPGEMSVSMNEDIVLAPTYIQETMNLKNSGWVFAVKNGASGMVPLNYLVLNKTKRQAPVPVLKNNNNGANSTNDNSNKNLGTKRVSFGENQIFENMDLDDIIKKAENEAKQYKKSCENGGGSTT